MRSGTVYIVDDDASVRTGLVRVVEALGYAAIACADGPSFLRAVDESAPACALIDACLPGLSGLDVLSSLRDARVGIPVILMTGRPQVQDCVRAMKEGAIDFLTKPLHKDDLLAAIRTAHLASINGQRKRSESRRAAELLARLTVRERQVLALVLEGRRNKEIASTLDSQEATVKVHRSRLMRKLGVRSVPELVQLSDAGNLAALLRRDRATPSTASADAHSSPDAAVAPAPHSSELERVWLAANGSWSGFTWTPRIANTRRSDA